MSDMDKALREQDQRWNSVHDFVEAAREMIRAKIVVSDACPDLFRALQDALYTIRGRKSLDDLLALTAALPHLGAQREEIAREADKLIAGLRRESERPFSGYAYGPVEAVEKLRDAILSLPACR